MPEKALPTEWRFGIGMDCHMSLVPPTNTFLDVKYRITGRIEFVEKVIELALSNIEFDEDPERTWVRWEEAFFEGMRLMLKEHKGEIIEALEPTFRQLERQRWLTMPPEERIRHEKDVP
jgi:hypothetical protein